MKRIGFVVALLVLAAVFIAAPAAAQYGRAQNINTVPSHFYTQFASSRAYVASQSDTFPSATGSYYAGGARVLDLYNVYNDSVYVICLVQKRTSPSGSWAFAAGDTVNHTGGGAVSTSTHKVLDLRDGDTDVIDGAGTQIRVIFNFQATLCGVTTPTYSAQLRWKP